MVRKCPDALGILCMYTRSRCSNTRDRECLSGSLTFLQIYTTFLRKFDRFGFEGHDRHIISCWPQDRAV